ncbi:hypothetical protein AEGHOMDF_1013 [Methylobacterium soli]|nr:hypothetical protein AEGHOMDF_1013 [Methylobacterium soli]
MRRVSVGASLPAHQTPDDETLVNQRTQILIAGAVIVALATAAVLMVLNPDDPKVALGDTAAAALFASIIVLGKMRRDQWER